MPWGIAYFDAPVAAGAGNGVPAGLFVPRDSALPGITLASELTDANRERKVAYSIATQLFDVIDPLTNKLGLAVSRPIPAGVATNRINQSFTFTNTFMVNHSNNSIGVLPLPGTNVGLVALETVFPGCSFVAAEGAIPEPGIVVPNTVITAVGGSVPGNVAADARSYLNGLFYSMVSGLDANAAVVAAQRGAAVGVAPAVNFTGTGAITGIDAADLPLRSFFSVTYTLTLQLALNQSAQTFDLAS